MMDWGKKGEEGMEKMIDSEGAQSRQPEIPGSEFTLLYTQSGCLHLHSDRKAHSYIKCLEFRLACTSILRRSLHLNVI